MKQILYLPLFLLLISCTERKNRHKLEYPDQSINDNNSSFNPIDYLPEDNNYHSDPNYKYQYRTGSSEDYEYNYDISGSDENGSSVYGNININGKYGSGTIQDENGNEKNVDVEWIDQGILEGTDEDGNSYEFEVE